MMNPDWIIPLPPGATYPAATGESKPAMGLYPCLGGCGQYGIVKLDNGGSPYAACSRAEITHKGGCGRVYGKKSMIPEASEAVYQERLALLSDSLPIPEEYSRFLSSAWNRYSESEGQDNV